MKINILALFKAAGIPALVFASLILGGGGCKKTSEPHIVLIVIDTLRSDHLPFYGYPINTAPFLSALAARGVLFENAFSASSWTAPATTSIFTSLYPFQHGVVSGIRAVKGPQIDIQSIPDGIRTLPEMLQKRGYKTYGAANNPNIGEEMGFSRGFDQFTQFADDEDQAMFARLETWAGEIQKQEKYFLYIHFNDCHFPYVCHEPCFEPERNRNENNILAYNSEIRFVDEKINRLYDRYGWDKNTLLIVTADHGEEFREHQRIRHGATLYSEVIRVPLLMVFPGEGPAGKRIKTHVSTLDILPTLRSYLDVKKKQTEEGADLMSLMKGESDPFPERSFYSHLVNKRGDGTKKIQGAVIKGEWKFIFTKAGTGRKGRELFHIKTDPRDLHNVLRKNPAMADLLAARFDEFENKCEKYSGVTRTIVLNKKKMEELRTLGYVR